MAIHELDELQPSRWQSRTAKPALAGDLDETAVRFDVPTKGGGVLLCSAVVHHDGERVERVSLPEHFRDWAVAAGLDRLDEDFEAYLWATAKMAFARQATHLTCAKCGLEKNAPDASRYRCSAPAHDWTVAR